MAYDLQLPLASSCTTLNLNTAPPMSAAWKASMNWPDPRHRLHPISALAHHDSDEDGGKPLYLCIHAPDPRQLRNPQSRWSLRWDAETPPESPRYEKLLELEPHPINRSSFIHWGTLTRPYSSHTRRIYVAELSLRQRQALVAIALSQPPFSLDEGGHRQWTLTILVRATATQPDGGRILQADEVKGALLKLGEILEEDLGPSRAS